MQQVSLLMSDPSGCVCGCLRVLEIFWMGAGFRHPPTPHRHLAPCHQLRPPVRWRLPTACALFAPFAPCPQAASGAGAAAMEELRQQTRDVLDGKPAAPKIFPQQVQRQGHALVVVCGGSARCGRCWP